MIARAALIALGLLSFGCSDSADGKGGSSSDKQLKDLSPAELKTQCNATKADFDTIAHGGCILDARETEDCEGAADACSGISGIDCDAIVDDDVSDCEVTVGELKSCMSKLASYFQKITCSEGPTTAPPDCIQSVQEKCSLFD